MVNSPAFRAAVVPAGSFRIRSLYSSSVMGAPFLAVARAPPGEPTMRAAAAAIAAYDHFGADAIVAMRYDATEFGQGATEVLAYGTAVKLGAAAPR